MCNRRVKMYIVFTGVGFPWLFSGLAPESRGELPPVFEGLGHLPLFRQAVHQKMDHSIRQSVSNNMAAITPAIASHCPSPSVRKSDPLFTCLQSTMVPCALSLSLFFIYAVFLSTCFLFSHMALVQVASGTLCYMVRHWFFSPYSLGAGILKNHSTMETKKSVLWQPRRKGFHFHCGKWWLCWQWNA